MSHKVAKPEISIFGAKKLQSQARCSLPRACQTANIRTSAPQSKTRMQFSGVGKEGRCFVIAVDSREAIERAVCLRKWLVPCLGLFFPWCMFSSTFVETHYFALPHIPLSSCRYCTPKMQGLEVVHNCYTMN